MVSVAHSSSLFTECLWDKSEQLSAVFNSIEGIVLNIFNGLFFFQSFLNKVGTESNMKIDQISRISVTESVMITISHLKLLRGNIYKYSFKGLEGEP